MARRSVRLLAFGAALAVLPALPVVAGDPSVALPSLWVVDDVLGVTADVTLDGDLTTSFGTPNTAISSVAVDPLDGTLWGANEGGRNGAGKLVNYDTDGTVVREIPAGAFGAFGVEGVDVAPDGSLWVVDDPDTEGYEDSVYHVDRHGSFLSSFTMASIALEADSPQDIAVDPTDGSLWITDNGADAVYNVAPDGSLLRSFATTGPAFAAAVGNPDGITNPQGITVEAADVLWLTSRATGHLVQIDTSGGDPVVTDVLPAAVVAPGAANPTGVAYSSTTTAPSTRAAVTLLRDVLVDDAPDVDRRSAKWLDRAIAQLDGAVSTDAFWTEDGEPADEGGVEALATVKNAVRFLGRVRGDAPTVAAVAASLVDLNRAAAVDQIERARELPTDPSLVAEAEAKIAEGDAVAAGSPERAANDYKAAWETATLAITQFFAPPGGSLWIVDDVARVSANVTPTGGPNFSIATPNTAISSIVVDPLDGTLWGANEGGRNGAGKLVNYDLTGAVLREIQATAFGAFGVEGIAFAPDGTLWVVDDPDVDGREDSVYNVARDGTLIASFPTSTFDAAATSPQDIAYSTYDDTLWITDNGADVVFNVATDGTLLGSFSTRAGVFVTAETPSGLTNPQGITVESPVHLWITDRSAGLLVRVDTTGSFLLQQLPASVVAEGAGNPTGIAYLPTVPSQPVVEVTAVEQDSTPSGTGGTEAGTSTTDGSSADATRVEAVTEATTEEVPVEGAAEGGDAVQEPPAETTTGTAAGGDDAAEEPPADAPTDTPTDTAAGTAPDGGDATEGTPTETTDGTAADGGDAAEEPPADTPTEAADDGAAGAPDDGAGTAEDEPPAEPGGDPTDDPGGDG